MRLRAPAVKTDPRRPPGPPPASRASGRRGGLWIAAVVLCFGLPLFVGLGRADMGDDEAIYSFAADVMVASGDWLTPRSSPSEDLPFLEKPPLKFWIVAAPIRLGLLPDDEFGLRFWDAAFGGAAFLYLFLMGRRVGGTVAGLAAVLVLAVHRPLVFEHGLRSNNMEAALVLAYCGGLYHALQWRTSGEDRRGRAHAFALTLYFVLAFMTKFVAALFMPAIIGAALLAHRDDRQRAVRWWRTWLAAAGLALLLIAPWFVYQYFRFGPLFVDQMFGGAVVQRFTSFVDPEHVKPWHFYFTALWSELSASGTAAWVAAGLVMVLWRTLRTGWPDGAMLLLWFALPVCAISLGTSKLYHYLYPFLPPLALAAGYAASVAWLAVAQLAARLDDAAGRFAGARGRRALDTPAARLALGAVALIGGAVAVAALAAGGFRIAIDGHTLFKAATPARGLALMIIALVVAGRAGRARFVIATLVLAAALPLAQYRTGLSALTAGRHPLRSIRDCVRGVSEARSGPGARVPVYAEEPAISHPAAFYLRTVGRLTVGGPSNERLFSALYVTRGPAAVTAARYFAFEQWLDARRAAGAGPGLIDAGALAAAGPLSSIPVVPLPRGLLILPGPYGACAPGEGTALRR